MSTTFNIMGYTSFTNNNALLIVTTDTNSIVIAQKNNLILTPIMWTQNTNTDLSCALFSIPASTFDSSDWVITSTLSGASASKTIVIDSAREYEINIEYHVPPTDYQEVEYIESSGSQYIKLPITSNNIASGEIKFYIVSSVDYAFVFGSSSDSTSSVASGAYGLRISTVGSGQGFQYNQTVTALSVSTTSTDYVVSFNTKSGSQSYVVNGSSTTASISGTINDRATYLFTFNYNNNIKSAENSKTRIYYFICYNNNGAKILEAYPCYRKSDGVIGMWDKVSETFLTNAGSGTFTKGLDV